MAIPPDSQPDSNLDSRRQWDGVAAGWERWWPTIERGAASVSERMLTLGAVGEGQQVLDIATGIGEPALLAAQRVGPSGRVVASDISPRMLAIARERAADLCLANVDFMEAAVSHLPFPEHSFDTILCRWGITSLPRYPDILVAIRRMLRPTGAFITAIWEEGTRSRPLAAHAAAMAQEISGLPSPSQEGVAPAGAARDRLEQAFLHAGFRRVHLEEVALTLRFASANDCVQYLHDVSPDLHTSLDRMSAAEQAHFGQRLAERLAPYRQVDGGVVIPNITLCAVSWP